MNTAPDDTSDPPGDPPASVVYEITFTDEYIMELWRHWRQSKRRSRIFMRVFRVVAGVLLVGLLALVIAIGHREHWHLAAALLVILGVLVFSEQIDGWNVKRRWRKGHHQNRQARVSVTSEGMSGRSDLGHSSTKWAAYTTAWRYPDGFLIFSGPYLPRWLPNSALVQGTPDDAAALFKGNIPNYQEA